MCTCRCDTTKTMLKTALNTIPTNQPQKNKKKNQSVENPGMAFVKGANERIEFLNKRTIMYEEKVWTNKAKD